MKRREKMKEKMKIVKDERKEDFFQKMFQHPQTRQMNSPIVSKKIPSDELFLDFFFESSESDRFFHLFP